jgi:hypothetical protein
MNLRHSVRRDQIPPILVCSDRMQFSLRYLARYVAVLCLPGTLLAPNVAYLKWEMQLILGNGKCSTSLCRRHYTAND